MNIKDSNINLNVADSHGRTALMMVVTDGYTKLTKSLLDNGADPNQADNNGVTPLLFATHKRYPQIAKILLDNGANPNQATNNGITPLLLTAQEGYPEITKILLDHGANPNQTMKNDGVTPLLWTAQKGYPEIAKMLLDHGANPNLADNSGRTALEVAQRNNNNQIVRLIHAANGRNFTTPKVANTAEQIYENVWRSVVVVKTEDSQGSGVIIKPNIVATNCHVIDDGGDITVYEHDNHRASTDTTFRAFVSQRNNGWDLCLLTVSGLRGVPANIRNYSTLNIGENVYALGSPKGLDLSLSTGIISQLRRRNENNWIQTDAAISPGSSGGGLFDSDGNLIGITIAKDATAKDIGFAIPADLIFSFQF